MEPKWKAHEAELRGAQLAELKKRLERAKQRDKEVAEGVSGLEEEAGKAKAKAMEHLASAKDKQAQDKLK